MKPVRVCARAIGPDDGKARLHVEAEVEIGEQGRAARVRKADVHKAQDGRRDGRGRREAELVLCSTRSRASAHHASADSQQSVAASTQLTHGLPDSSDNQHA